MSTRTPPLSQPQREQRFSNGGFDLSTLGPWRAVCFAWVSGKPNSSTDYEAILPSPVSIVLQGFITGSDPELIDSFPVTGNRISSNLPLGTSVTLVRYHGALLSMLSVRTCATVRQSGDMARLLDGHLRLLPASRPLRHASQCGLLASRCLLAHYRPGARHFSGWTVALPSR